MTLLSIKDNYNLSFKLFTGLCESRFRLSRTGCRPVEEGSATWIS